MKPRPCWFSSCCLELQNKRLPWKSLEEMERSLHGDDPQQTSGLLQLMMLPTGQATCEWLIVRNRLLNYGEFDAEAIAWSSLHHLRVVCGESRQQCSVMGLIVQMQNLRLIICIFSAHTNSSLRKLCHLTCRAALVETHSRNWVEKS